MFSSFLIFLKSQTFRFQKNNEIEIFYKVFSCFRSAPFRFQKTVIPLSFFFFILMFVFAVVSISIKKTYHCFNTTIFVCAYLFLKSDDRRFHNYYGCGVCNLYLWVNLQDRNPMENCHRLTRHIRCVRYRPGVWIWSDDVQECRARQKKSGCGVCKVD